MVNKDSEEMKQQMEQEELERKKMDQINKTSKREGRDDGFMKCFVRFFGV